MLQIYFDFYLANEYWFAYLQLALAMFGMGATLRVSDFITVIKEFHPFMVGTVLQIILVPCIAYVMINSFDFHPGVAIGLALCASIPGGTMSNVITYLGRGDVALSVSLTAVTSFTCIITTPIVLGLLLTHYEAFQSFDMPSGKIAWDIVTSVIVPLLVGMVFLTLMPKHAGGVARNSILVSVAIIVLIILGSIGSGRVDLPAFGFVNAFYVIAFIATVSIVGIVIPVLFKFRTTEVTAISVEIALRNINLAILIKAIVFPVLPGQLDPLGDMVLLTVLFYGGAQMFAAFPIAGIFYLIISRRDTAG